MGVIVTCCKTGLIWAGIVWVGVIMVLPARDTPGEIVDAAVIMMGLDPNGIPDAPAIIVPVGMIGASGGGRFVSFDSVSPGIRRIRSTFGALTGASTVGDFRLAWTSMRCCSSLLIVQLSTITICDWHGWQ